MNTTKTRKIFYIAIFIVAVILLIAGLCRFFFNENHDASFLPHINDEVLKFDQIVLNYLQISINMLFSLPETRKLLHNTKNEDREIRKILSKAFVKNRVRVTNKLFQEIKNIIYPKIRYSDDFFNYPLIRFINVFTNLYDACFTRNTIEETKKSDYYKNFYYRVELEFYSEVTMKTKILLIEDNGNLIITKFSVNKLVFESPLLDEYKHMKMLSFKFHIYPLYLFVRIQNEEILNFFVEINLNKESGFTKNLADQAYRFAGLFVENYDTNNIIYFEMKINKIYKFMNNLITKSSNQEILDVIEKTKYKYLGLFKKIN